MPSAKNISKTLLDHGRKRHEPGRGTVTLDFLFDFDFGAA